MKYKFVQILPTVDFDGWSVFFGSDDQDRERTKTDPSPMGHYWYPRSMADKSAFDRLKACMIRKHRQEIERLQKSMAELERFEFGKSKSTNAPLQS